MTRRRQPTEDIRQRLDGVLRRLIHELESVVEDLDELDLSEGAKAREEAACALAATEATDCTYVLLRVPHKETGLTARERQVALLAADGLRNKEISNRLGIREATVSAHIRQAIHKLRLKSRSELILQRGLLQRGRPNVGIG